MIGKMVVFADYRILEELIRTCHGKPTRIVHDGVPYGVMQEFGTSRMAARPWMTPGIEKFRSPFIEGLKQISNMVTADKYVEKTARDAQAYIKNSFGSSPSPPGGPPGVDTGELKRSIDVHKPEEL